MHTHTRRKKEGKDIHIYIYINKDMHFYDNKNKWYIFFLFSFDVNPLLGKLHLIWMIWRLCNFWQNVPRKKNDRYIYIYIKKNGCVVWIGRDRVKIKKNTLYSCISDCCALILSKASGCCIHMPPTADVETKEEEDSMLFRWRSEMCTLISKLYLFIWLFARWSNIRCGIKKASTEKRNFVKWQMDKEKKIV